MHSDVRADVQAHPAATRLDQQRIIDRWRQEFNHVRPHQALGGKTPAEAYKVLDRKRPVLVPYVYPKHFYTARVSGSVLRFRMLVETLSTEPGETRSGFCRDTLFADQSLLFPIKLSPSSSRPISTPSTWYCQAPFVLRISCLSLLASRLDSGLIFSAAFD